VAVNVGRAPSEERPRRTASSPGSFLKGQGSRRSTRRAGTIAGGGRRRTLDGEAVEEGDIVPASVGEEKQRGWRKGTARVPGRISIQSGLGRG
jgi:hypothetical protein